MPSRRFSRLGDAEQSIEEVSMRVCDLMTREPFTCLPTEPMSRAAQVMWEHDCGCVPIVDGSQRLVGMITDRDLAMAAYTQGKPLAEIPIARAMTRHVEACEQFAPIAAAQEHMRRAGLRRLPIIDAAGLLIGVLTLSDLCRGYDDAAGLGASEVPDTLAAVLCHHLEPLPDKQPRAAQ